MLLRFFAFGRIVVAIVTAIIIIIVFIIISIDVWFGRVGGIEIGFSFVWFVFLFLFLIFSHFES